MGGATIAHAVQFMWRLQNMFYYAPRKAEQLSGVLEWWLNKVDTDPDLTDSIAEYVQWQDTVLMEDIVQEAPSRFHIVGKSQDKIGWRRFLEGMILKEITGIQQQYYALNGMQMSLEKWSSGLITRLLEIMHAQLIYQYFIVHDPVSDIIATAKKEELLLAIGCQRNLGDAGLLEEDKYLAEVNLEGLETAWGEQQHYWLLAIKTAWNAKILQEQQE
jgi:hypothetical protein